MPSSEKLTIRRPANSNLQNEINISVIFNFLRTMGPSYRALISKSLNISAPAVSRAVEHLIEKGYLIESGTIKTAHGKNAAEVMINPDIGYIVAIDLVKDHARFAVTDFLGTIQEEHSVFTVYNTDNLKEMIIGEISKISSIYQDSKTMVTELKAISVGIPAATNFATGSIHTVLYKNLESFDIKELLAAEYQVPVFIENISNLSAIGELNCGHGRNYSNIIFLEISNGIGAGIISNGMLLQGRSGYAGEIGYTIPTTDHLGSLKQRKGALERIASIDSMIFDLKKELAFGTVSAYFSDPDALDTIDGVMLFEAAINGDPLSKRLIERAVKHVAQCAINLILTLDPEIIFIGGDIYHMPGVIPLFIEPLKEYVKEAIPFDAPRIQLSSLGEDAGLIGAANMAVETLLTGKYPYRIE